MYENLKVSEVIQLSIEKWEAIVAGTGYDDRRHNCALCQRFYNIDYSYSYDGGCIGCPIYSRTLKPFCRDTPYDKWLGAIELEQGDAAKWPIKATTEHLRKIAKEELEFLRKVLETQLEEERS